MLWSKGGVITLVPEVPLKSLGRSEDVQGGPAGEIELIVNVVLRSFFEVEDFVDFPLYRQAAGQLATAAFIRIWDNPSDADYDRL